MEEEGVAGVMENGGDHFAIVEGVEGGGAEGRRGWESRGWRPGGWVGMGVGRATGRRTGMTVGGGVGQGDWSGGVNLTGIWEALLALRIDAPRGLSYESISLFL